MDKKEEKTSSIIGNGEGNAEDGARQGGAGGGGDGGGGAVFSVFAEGDLHLTHVGLMPI